MLSGSLDLFILVWIIFRSHSELSDSWEVLFDDISLQRIIGEGAFGKVYRGELLKELVEVGKRKFLKRKAGKEEQQTNKGLTVAVKMLQNGATEEQIQDFLEEIQLMKQIGYHRNILNLLASCTVTNPMFLVVEFAKNGDLLQYLRERREQIKQAFDATGETAPHHSRYQNIGVINEGSLYDCTSDKNRCETIAHRSIRDNSGPKRDFMTHRDNLHDDETLRPADLMTFAWQIAKGMEFLSCKGFVHRDLAARNVLVCEGKLVKVADFGLSRNVYAEKVYHASKTRKLPIKWMSPEAIHDQVFTAESDVYKLMRHCWTENPAERPSFTVIWKQLERMMLHQCPYLDMADATYSYAPCYDVETEKETELENTAV